QVLDRVARLLPAARGPRGEREDGPRQGEPARTEIGAELLGRLVRIPVLLIPRRTASVLLRLPLMLTTVDPVDACVFACMLLVSRCMSPRLSGPPRVVAVPPAVLSSLHAVRL